MRVDDFSSELASACCPPHDALHQVACTDQQSANGVEPHGVEPHTR